MAAQTTKTGGNFQLTMPKVKATFAAYTELATLLASDPALLARFQSAKKALPDTNGRDTMGLTAAKLSPEEPRIAAIFRKAGTTPQQTADTLETLLGCIFGEAMLQSMKGDASKLPADVAANLAFYRQNKVEIDNVFREFGAKAASLGVKDTEDEDDAEDEEAEEEETEKEND